MSQRPSKLKKQELLDRVATSIGSGDYVILPHARQRCTERDVSAPDIEEALTRGRHVPRRDRYDDLYRSWSYGFEGPSIDEVPLRVIVAFEDQMLVVTVVRL
jgi:hypothetical protein